MSDVSRPPAGPRSPLWMKIALGLSVALNLAVAGMAGGAFWRLHSDGISAGPVRDLGFGPFAGALSPDDRAAMRREFFENRGDFRELRREMRRDFTETLVALRAEPFDPAVLQTLLERQRARGAAAADLGSRLLAERIAAMSPEDRRAFADRLEQDLTRRRHHRGPTEGGFRGDVDFRGPGGRSGG